MIKAGDTDYTKKNELHGDGTCIRDIGKGDPTSDSRLGVAISGGS